MLWATLFLVCALCGGPIGIAVFFIIYIWLQKAEEMNHIKQVKRELEIERSMAGDPLADMGVKQKEAYLRSKGIQP